MTSAYGMTVPPSRACTQSHSPRRPLPAPGVGQLRLFGTLCLAAFLGVISEKSLVVSTSAALSSSVVSFALGILRCSALFCGALLHILRGGRSRGGAACGYTCGGGARLGASYHLVITLRCTLVSLSVASVAPRIPPGPPSLCPHSLRRSARQQPSQLLPFRRRGAKYSSISRRSRRL